MTVPTMDEVSGWVGLPVRDPGGTELGRCDRLYADRDSGDPEWLLLHHTGSRGSFFVPVRGVREHDGAIEVPWPDSVVFSSPTLGNPGTLTDEDEARLYRHYDLPRTPPAGGGVAAAARGRFRQLTPAATRGRKGPVAALAAVLGLLALALTLVRRRRR